MANQGQTPGSAQPQQQQQPPMGAAGKPPGGAGSTGQGNPQRTQMLANQQMNQRNAIQAAGGNPGAYTSTQLAQMAQMTGGTPSPTAVQNAQKYAAPTENAYQQGMTEAQNYWNKFARDRQSTAGVPGAFQPGAAQNVKPGGAPGSTGPLGQPANYQGALNAQFGAGNPFGQRDWYGGNPLETAQAAAQRAFDENLANIRARFAGMGTPGSARQAIAEGTALGEFGTGLGDVLAQRGEGAYQNDATRGLQALLGAGNLQNVNNSLALQANQQLGGLGTGLTGLGASEQGIPNLGELLALLGAFQSIAGTGGSRSKGSSGFGFKT